MLAFYWLTFRVSYIIRNIHSEIEEHISTTAALLNTLLLLGLLKFQSVQPQYAYLALLIVGALEFAFAQLPVTRRRRQAFVLLTVMGAALMLAAPPFHYSGNNVAILWLLGAEIFLFAGVIAKEVVFRRIGLLTGAADRGASGNRRREASDSCSRGERSPVARVWHSFFALRGGALRQLSGAWHALETILRGKAGCLPAGRAFLHRRSVGRGCGMGADGARLDRRGAGGRDGDAGAADKTLSVAAPASAVRRHRPDLAVPHRDGELAHGIGAGCPRKDEVADTAAAGLRVLCHREVCAFAR